MDADLSYNIKASKKNTFKHKIYRYKYLYILMIPGALWYLIFHILPLYGVVIAFQDYKPLKGIFESEWVGLKHFANLVGSASFISLLKNTVIISSLKLVCGFPMPIILALSLNAINNKIFKKSVQTMSYLPNFLSWIIVYGISFTIFNKYFGVVKGIYDFLHITYSDPTSQAATFIPFLVVSAIWKGMGMASIIYLAALSGIDSQLYEAATIDGASKWQQLRKITIPSIMPICAIVLILSVGGLLSGDFEQIYIFAGANPELIRMSDVFETYIYRNGIRALNFSAPAAVGIFQSLFGAILVLITNKITKKFGYEGIW